MEEPETTGARAGTPSRGALARRVAALDAACAAGSGALSLPGGALPLTNLQKVFFPARQGEPALTKGGLLRYYLEMSPHILPAMRDRPLVLRRFPDGIGGKAFYQQAAGEEVPDGVRRETVVVDSGEESPRFVGGSLPTLLHTVQLGAVSYDPWHSRVGRLAFADYAILDLDPTEGTPFRRVIEVARRVREEMERAGLHGALKTSGSTGVHIYLPLPPRTPLEAARLIAEIVATRVATAAPRIATVERSVRKRRRGTVYVDYLQNILGKTVAGVYAVRARPGAPVSTPLAWEELADDLDPRAFTVRTVPGRVREVGDLWRPAMRRPNRLATLLS
jgi:bifunctional non-homologous end joining protein LigD